MSEKVYFLHPKIHEEVKKSGCPLVYQHENLWVSEDVHKAIQIYVSMNGYAGLTLSEYLIKMGLGKGVHNDGSGSGVA